MKTIFITIFQGVEARNILRTDIYKELAKRPDVRLILFTNSQNKKEYYEKEFFGKNIIYEVVENYTASGLQRFFGAVKFNLINTATVDVKRQLSFRADKSYLKFSWRFLFNRVFAHRSFRKLIRWLDWSLVSDRFFAFYFEKYQPDIVFMAHLFGGVETAMLREARHRRVATVGLINSWDKVTARAMIRLLPDWMLVHNDLVKDDVMEYADMPAGRIVPVGVPHFDHYIKEKRTAKKDFFQKWNLDPGKKIILYLPVGRTASDDDQSMLDFFDEILSGAQFKPPAQLIVRFPPNDDVVIGSHYKNRIVFQMPGKRFSAKRGTDWDMSAEDLRDLADTIYYSDVVVGYPSTMMIDAAVFDKPIINIKFERGAHKQSFVLWAYKVAHYQPVLATGGVRLAHNESELVEWINNYLADPGLDSAGRKKIAETQCLGLDGRAGSRVADFLLGML